jgi:hypothetical protein
VADRDAARGRRGGVDVLEPDGIVRDRPQAGARVEQHGVHPVGEQPAGSLGVPTQVIGRRGSLPGQTVTE